MLNKLAKTKALLSKDTRFERQKHHTHFIFYLNAFVPEKPLTMSTMSTAIEGNMMLHKCLSADAFN
jgi:hypothetical protein